MLPHICGKSVEISWILPFLEIFFFFTFFILPHVKQWPTSQRGVDGSQYKEETSADDPFSDIMTHYGAQSPSQARL